ncbi:MAG: peptide chain release factor N(5)-glutamine methyltransferase, partial [Microbacterium sp.]
MPETLQARLRAIAARFADAGIPDPTVDAELLAGHVLGLSRGAVQA